MSNTPTYCMTALAFAALISCIYIQKSDFDKLAELYAVHPPMIVAQMPFPESDKPLANQKPGRPLP